MTIPQLSLDDAWTMLESDDTSVLIDVRTEHEWQTIGVPDMTTLGREARFVEWNQLGGVPNPAFIEQATVDVAPEQNVLLLCRSGARSNAAAQALIAAGFTNAYNIAAGFEGDEGPDGRRHGGWKDALPSQTPQGSTAP